MRTGARIFNVHIQISGCFATFCWVLLHDNASCSDRISCYSSLPNFNVCCGVKVKCCSSVPLMDQTLCLNHLYSQASGRSGPSMTLRMLWKVETAFVSTFDLYLQHEVKWFYQELKCVLCPDQLRSWYTWLHQRAACFNIPSPVNVLSVLKSIELVLHLISVEALNRFSLGSQIVCGLQMTDTLLKLFRCSVLLLSSAFSATDSEVVGVLWGSLIITGSIINLSLYTISF